MSGLQRAVSQVGKAAKFGSAEEEITRIIAHKTNYYICLKVRSLCISAVKVPKLAALSNALVVA